MSKGVIHVFFIFDIFPSLPCSSVSSLYDVNIKAFCKEGLTVSCGAFHLNGGNCNTHNEMSQTRNYALLVVE